MSGAVVEGEAEEVPAVVWASEETFREAVEDPGVGPVAALLRIDLAHDRPLASLLVNDLHRRGMAVRVAKAPPDWLAGRRARAGAPGRQAKNPGFAVLARRMRGEKGQALPAALGAVGVLMIVALAIASIAAATVP